MTRTRVCNNPKPNNGGKYCTGDPKEDIKRTCQIEGKKNPTFIVICANILYKNRFQCQCDFTDHIYLKTTLKRLEEYVNSRNVLYNIKQDMYISLIYMYVLIASWISDIHYYVWCLYI